MKNMESDDLIVVLRDRAQEWDLKHTYLSDSESMCLPKGYNRVWYTETYDDKDDVAILQERFGEQYEILEKQSGMGGFAPLDILMPIVDNAGQTSFVKINNGKEGERKCLQAFDDDLGRLFNLIAIISSYSGATQIDASFSADKGEMISAEEKNAASSEIKVKVKGKAPINGVPSEVGGGYANFQENENSDGQQHETEENFSKGLRERFQKNKRLADWEEKSNEIVRKAGFENDETIKLLMEKIKHRAHVEANEISEIKSNMSFLVWIWNKLMWLLGIDKKKTSPAYSNAEGDVIEFLIHYKGYMHCKELINQAQEMSKSISLGCGYGPIGGGISSSTSMSLDFKSEVTRKIKAVMNMKVRLFYSA